MDTETKPECGPEGRRIYHDGLLHDRKGLVAALNALADRLRGSRS